MKIFFSWSKQLSEEVARLFETLIKDLFPQTERFFSPVDIKAGSTWFSSIQKQLQSTDYGIFFVTKENMKEPWLLFEAGAIAKNAESSRCCTILIDVKETDIDAPLSMFNHTTLEIERLDKLLKQINDGQSVPLSEKVMETQLHAELPRILERVELLKKAKSKPGIPEKTSEQKMDEILLGVRALINLQDRDLSGAPHGFVRKVHPTNLIADLTETEQASLNRFMQKRGDKINSKDIITYANFIINSRKDKETRRIENIILNDDSIIPKSDGNAEEAMKYWALKKQEIANDPGEQ